MALAQGDIVIIGMDAESWDRFAILATDDLDAGEVVRITTSDWDAGQNDFTDETNYIEWTVPAGGIPAGQTIVFSEQNGSTWRTGTPDSLYSNQFGAPVEVGEVNISGETNGITNEEIFIFQGDPGNPYVVSGLITNNSSSPIPPGLTNTTGLVNVTGNNSNSVDLAEYNGISTGTQAEILAAVGNPANWGHEGGREYNGGTGGTSAGETDLLDGFDLLNTTFDIICFTPGVLITTPTGEIPVETLKIGDLVITMDNGIQPIRWIGSKKLSGARLHACDHMRPIKIAAGSLGRDLPSRDMWVSPQHRMLVKDPIASALFGHGETLSPAKGMVNGTDITIDRSKTSVQYIHLLFDTHQVIFANGSATESFHPGEASINGLTDAARSEVYSLFPELRANKAHFGPSARPSLSVPEMQMITTEKTGYRPADTPITHVW